jgi:hypothetical protein
MGWPQKEETREQRSQSFSHFIFCCAALGRYDYEEVDLDAAIQMMEDLELRILGKAFMGQRFAVGEKLYQVEKADNFEYTDPVDGRICRNQVRNGGGYFGRGHRIGPTCHTGLIHLHLLSLAGPEDNIHRWLPDHLQAQWNREYGGNSSGLHRQL